MTARNSLWGGWLIWLAGAMAGLPAAAGQEFRVDTEVFFGQEKQPALETLTIFSSGMVYDFVLTAPQELAVLDAQRGRLILLDESRQVKTGISTQELLDFTLKLEAEAVQKKDSLLAFAARPQFETTAEDILQNGQQLVRLKLAARPLEYVIVGQKPERVESVQMYRHFADWYARLNAMQPGNLPPGARLAVNQALAERGLLPLEITRTIPAASPLGKKIEVKSRHLPNWTLSGEDRKRIEQAGNWMAQFKQVSFEDYRKGR